ncbi:hypothetical protein OQA88_9133 [Cercophora sp. LCS_1]
MRFDILLSAAGLPLVLASVSAPAPLRVRNPPGVSSGQTLGHLARSLNSLKIAGRDQIFSSNRTVLDTTWNGATLLALGASAGFSSGTVGDSNSSVSLNGGVRVSCETCYIKGVVSASLTIKGDPEAVFSNYTSEVKGAVRNVTKEVFDIVGDYLEDTLRAAAEDLINFDKPDIRDYQLPTIDVDFDVDLAPLPDVSVRFEFDDGFELFMQLNTKLEVGATYTINLFTSKSPIGVGLGSDVSAGITVAIDLVLDIRDAIDLSSGFHLKLDKGVGMTLNMFSRNVADINFPGGEFEFLPVTLISNTATLSGILRVALQAGLELDPSTIPGFQGLQSIPYTISAGVVAEVFANVAEFSTSVTVPLVDNESPARCDLDLIQAFQFALGAGAGATVGLGTVEWGPVPETVVPIFYTTLASACATRKTVEAAIPTLVSGVLSPTLARPTSTSISPTRISSSLRTATSARATSTPESGSDNPLDDILGVIFGRDDLVPTTLLSTTVFTGLSCMSTGVINCPASLQASSTFTSVLSHVTAVPSGARPTFPATRITVVSAVPFGTGAVVLKATSGEPVSYVPPPPTAAPASDGEGTGTEVSRSTSLGLGLGLGLGGSVALIGGLIFYMRRKQTWRSVPESPSQERIVTERDWAPKPKGDTEELISSSSKAARDARNKGGSSTLTNQDVIDTYTIAIERLEEEYEKAEEELKGLKELMEPRSP